jgi:hypothetical protein
MSDHGPKDPANKLFPENRMRDETGSTIPTPIDADNARILNERIQREQAMYEQGFRFCAGHDMWAYNAGTEGMDDLEH